MDGLEINLYVGSNLAVDLAKKCILCTKQNNLRIVSKYLYGRRIFFAGCAQQMCQTHSAFRLIFFEMKGRLFTTKGIKADRVHCK